MHTRHTRSAPTFLLVGTLLAPVTHVDVASAHISLAQGGTHLSRYGDGEIKDGPCGRAGGARGTNIYTYAPGETITVSVMETIPHPGYFRIAFDVDGDDDFVDPYSIDPIDPLRPCPFDQFDHCGQADLFNTDAVLMDNLDPHSGGLFGTLHTWQVTLPNVECSNCTLQVIQVMEDTVHGPYAPKGTEPEVGYVEDIYHQCIDLVLAGAPLGSAGGAGSVGGTGGGAGSDPLAAGGGTDSGGAGGVAATAGAPTAGGDMMGDPGAGAGGGSGAPMPQRTSGDDGSCSVSNAPSPRSPFGWAVLLLPALLLRRRRRRSPGTGSAA